MFHMFQTKPTLPWSSKPLQVRGESEEGSKALMIRTRSRTTSLLTHSQPYHQSTPGKILKPSHFSPSQFHYHYLLENMRTNQSHQTCTSVHVNHHMEPRASWLYFIPLVSNLLWFWVQWDNIPSPSLLFLPIKHVPFWYIKYISENIE